MTHLSIDFVVTGRPMDCSGKPFLSAALQLKHGSHMSWPTDWLADGSSVDEVSQTLYPQTWRPLSHDERDGIHEITFPCKK